METTIEVAAKQYAAKYPEEKRAEIEASFFAGVDYARYCMENDCYDKYGEEVDLIF
jgi:hypothetical protein